MWFTFILVVYLLLLFLSILLEYLSSTSTLLMFFVPVFICENWRDLFIYMPFGPTNTVASSIYEVRFIICCCENMQLENFSGNADLQDSAAIFVDHYWFVHVICDACVPQAALYFLSVSVVFGRYRPQTSQKNCFVVAYQKSSTSGGNKMASGTLWKSGLDLTKHKK